MILSSKNRVVISFTFCKDYFYDNQPYFHYCGSNTAIIHGNSPRLEIVPQIKLPYRPFYEIPSATVLKNFTCFSSYPSNMKSGSALLFTIITCSEGFT